MENNIINHRNHVISQIQKSFEPEIEKAVYADTPENRKLGRVGQEWKRSKNKKMQDISSIKDKDLRDKIAKHIEDITDGEYSDGAYTWKDVLRIARHPGEQSVRAYLNKLGISVSGVKKLKNTKSESSGDILSRIQKTPGFYISYPHRD